MYVSDMFPVIHNGQLCVDFLVILCSMLLGCMMRFLLQLFREVRIMTMLDHPNIGRFLAKNFLN